MVKAAVPHPHQSPAVTAVPLFVTFGDISPRRGENLSLPGEAFSREIDFRVAAKNFATRSQNFARFGCIIRAKDQKTPSASLRSAAPPRGSLCAVPETVPPLPKAVPLGKVASPQAMTEGVTKQRSSIMSNIVIVGSGPAGVSAALYAVRAGVQTTVLTKGSGALARAEKIENYYGFAQPVSGAELERSSIENARRLGVQFVQTEAVGLTWTDRLTVETLAGAYPADAVILATGASRAVPRIPGLTGLEGRGVSWCAACDAFFYRGKDVAVLGSGEYALHEVQALLPVVKSVTLLTGGAALTADFPPEVSVCTQKVEAVLGEQAVTGVQLADGTVREVSGVFIALGVAGSTALARKLGAAVEGSRIVVDDKMQTTVPGLYAAGDCTGGLLQVAKAVYEGALAGTEAAKALRKG